MRGMRKAYGSQNKRYIILCRQNIVFAMHIVANRHDNKIDEVPTTFIDKL